MTVLPLLARELKLESRRPANYALRSLGAALTFFVFMGLITREIQSPALLGAQLFPHFHTILFFAVWIVGPLVTADCLAREKREGTLDLLLLTRLTPVGIVAAKTFVHALRGASLVLAALPMLGIPFLLGGVSVSENLISALLIVSVLTLGLVSGVLASALAGSSVRAVLLSLALGCLFTLAFCSIFRWQFRTWIASLDQSGRVSAALPTLFSLNGWELLTDDRGEWGLFLAQLPRGADRVWIGLLEILLLGLVLVSILVLHCAGWIIQHRHVGWLQLRSWFQPRPASSAPVWWLRLQRKRRRILLRGNPLFWLQQRTWTSRATKWGWCGVILIAEVIDLYIRPARGWFMSQTVIGAGLVVGMIYASATSYRLEKHNGMLEMILITPLKPWLLISGRTRSLWEQFSVACVIWILSACLPVSRSLVNELTPVFFAVAFMLVITPVVGLDCAVNLRTKWAAILATGAAILLVPGTTFLYNLGNGSWGAVGGCFAILGLVGFLTLAGLHLQMNERSLGYLNPNRSRRRHRRRRHSKKPMEFAPRIVLRH